MQVVSSNNPDAEFPAHAGMNRSPPGSTQSWTRVPRTRGDEPRLYEIVSVNTAEFPAHARMNLLSAEAESGRLRVPRTRGDEPHYVPGTGATGKSSPHTRG